MLVIYNPRSDLLYLRLDDRKQQVINHRVDENVVLDLGEDQKIVGIEVLDASKALEFGKAAAGGVRNFARCQVEVALRRRSCRHRREWKSQKVCGSRRGRPGSRTHD